jgi:hypothetical protein
MIALARLSIRREMMVDEQKRNAPPRRNRKDDRTLHDVAREAFESRVAAGDETPRRPVNDVDRFG